LFLSNFPFRSASGCSVLLLQPPLNTLQGRPTLVFLESDLEHAKANKHLFPLTSAAAM